MKKFLVALAILSLIAVKVYADVQVQSNGTNVGVATKINVKGATTTRSGQTVTIDNTTLSGVNWSTASFLNSGINWTGANLTNSGINWNDIKAVQVSTAGVNWNFLDPISGGINWYNLANNATAAKIVCWKSNGQLGVCGTSVSGVSCTACN